MGLDVGAKLGPYEILAPLGAGGMGEVYRARDTRLGREVAIKVLPQQHLGDPVRRQRFLREAQAVSALNHPNIVTLHDVGQSGDLDFLVMEHVRGRTLDQVIPRDGLRLNDALRIALQIADGLRTAHAAGILHRDLKPRNVVVTDDGTAKILDFGLAKPLQQDDKTPPVSTKARTASLVRPASGDTAAGMVVGTVAYMSPEQAQGKTLDARSDVFGFGAVLYEMVTGRRAFQGDSAQAVLAAVIAEEPRPLRELLADVPRDLERIVVRCLRKDPGRRFHDMADVRVELLEVKEDSDSQAAAARVSAGGVARHVWRSRPAIVAVAVVATVAGVALWRTRPADLHPPILVPLTSLRNPGAASLSPDGTQVSFSANGDLWVKIIGEAESRQLTTDPRPDSVPVWSPDGREIAFLRAQGFLEATIHVMSALGGGERRLSDLVVWDRPSWSPDGRWLAAARSWAKRGDDQGVYLIPTAGGEPRRVTFPKPPAHDSEVAFSPDGRALAYGRCPGSEGGACDVYVLPLDESARPEAGARRLTLQGFYIWGLAWTRDGRSIVYGAASGMTSRLWRVRADGSNPPERVELAGLGAVGPGTTQGMDRLVFTRLERESDIRRLPLGGTSEPLVTSATNEDCPQYSPDGRRIAFASTREGERQEVWLANADGSNPTRLTRGPGREQGSPRWSPDGRTIAFDSRGAGGQYDVWTIGVDGSGLRQVTSNPADEVIPSWSRDGRLLYYSSSRTGRREIWRVPVAGGAEEQVTHEGGFVPFEAPDGRTLYYMKNLFAGPLYARPLAGGEERLVAHCVAGRSYAVTARGVLYLGCPAKDGDVSGRALYEWDAGTRHSRVVARLDPREQAGAGVSAAPDGKTVAYVRSNGGTSIMMIDSFR